MADKMDRGLDEIIADTVSFVTTPDASSANDTNSVKASRGTDATAPAVVVAAMEDVKDPVMESER